MKTKLISSRVTPATYAAIEAAAKKQDRTVSYMADHILNLWVCGQQQQALQALSEVAKPEQKPKAKRFVKPTHEDVRVYFQAKGRDYYVATEETNKFFDHYKSNGWLIGRNHTPMKCWKSAVNNWVRGGNNNGQAQGKRNSKSTFQELTDNTWAKGLVKG